MGKEELALEPTSTITDALALFDDQFSVYDFQEALNQGKKESNNVLAIIKQAVNKAANCDEDKGEYRYVVDLKSDTKKAIEDELIKFDKNSAGEMFAQIRGSNGRYGQRIPIKKELADRGVSVEEAEISLQLEAIRDQLESIMDALGEIDSRVRQVIQGQQNDRLGLFYSGLSLYVEARAISDPFLKKQITAQALKALSDANSQMIQEIRTNVEYLVMKQYQGEKRVAERIEEHLSVIHQCYDIVYRASFLKASIYHESGEIPAMLTAIDEYGRFVEKMIVPYAGTLSELDRHDQFIEKGTWGSISKTLIGCNKLKKQITQNHTYYLSVKEA